MKFTQSLTYFAPTQTHTITIKVLIFKHSKTLMSANMREYRQNQVDPAALAMMAACVPKKRAKGRGKFQEFEMTVQTSEICQIKLCTLIQNTTFRSNYHIDFHSDFINTESSPE